MPGQDVAALRERELLLLDRVGPSREPPTTRAVIRSSWARSAASGLRTGDLDVPFSSVFDLDSILVRCARPVLDVLRDALADEPVSILLCDETGLVLSRACGDRAILRSLDDVALAPGSTYSEASVGTNGFGLALASDRLALVARDEHFSTRLSGYVCAGSPIHDPTTGALLGALSLTTPSPERSALLLALAEQTALNIEAQLRIRTRIQSTQERADPGSGASSERRIPSVRRRRSQLTRLEAIERGAILVALERNAGMVADSADELGISRATLYRRIKRYGIQSFRTPVRQGRNAPGGESDIEMAY